MSHVATGVVVGAIAAGVGWFAGSSTVPPAVTVEKTVEKTIAQTVTVAASPTAVSLSDVIMKKRGKAKLQGAVVCIAPREDFGWGAQNVAAYEYLSQKYADYIEMKVSDNTPPAEGEKAMRDYAQLGYDVIFNAGDYGIETLQKLANEFPNVYWVGGMTFTPAPHLNCYDQKEEEAGYLGGIIQAMMTKTKKVAYIMGEALPDVVRVGEGAKQAVKAIDPTISYKEVIIGSWVDPAGSKEAALSLNDAGYDIIMHTVDLGVQGLIEAAKTRNFWWIGEGKDQNVLDPEHNLTSHLWRHDLIYEQGLLDVFADLKGEKPYGGVAKRYGLEELGEESQIAPLYHVPPEVAQAVSQAVQDIIAGKIEVKMITEPTP